MNETITNFATGDSIEFLETDQDTNGRMSRFIMTLAPKSSWAKSPQHFHPYQTETFKVISGELNIKVGDKHIILRPNDDKVVVDKFVPHCFWNTKDEEVSFVAEIFPPKNIEKGIRLTYQLSKLGRVNKNNIPTNPFYLLLLMNYFDAYFNFIPWKFQKFMFLKGAQLARLFGYRMA